MPPLMFQIAGGIFFVPATAVIVIASAVLASTRRRWISTLSTAAMVLAIATIAISSVPLAWWFYIAWAATACPRFFRRMIKPMAWRLALSGVFLGFTFYAGIAEFYHQRLHPLPAGRFGHLYVIGDSISAGLGRTGEITWPTILRAEQGLQVIDCSSAGCTVKQAFKRASESPPSNAVVLIEIGGNDVIDRTDPAQFAADLNSLVRMVKRPDTQVVMIELPLFPFDNSYGITQRQIASKYQIHLIPRRYLAAIFASQGAIVDGIHLSNVGQRKLAVLVWGVIHPAILSPAPTGRFQ